MDSRLRHKARLLCWPCMGIVLVWSLLSLCAVQAQAPASPVGRITGDDVSVSGPSGGPAPDDPRSILLSSGSEITVHAGRSRIDLAAGGEIGICGPAKLTLLESGGATTIALNLGRIHIHLGGPVPLTVYSPLVIAIPLALSEGPRDAIIGLENSGAMCVRAMNGGVRLEQQLTGETLVVPQPTEVFLEGGQFQPLHGATGSCQCDIFAASAIPPPPVLIAKPEPSGTSARMPGAAPLKPAPANPVEYSLPARTNDVQPDEKDPLASLPVREAPIWKVMMPPLMFDAATPTPPPGPSPETILLVREIRVEPASIFHGRVEGRPGPPVPKHAQVAKQPEQSAQRKPPKKNQPGGILGFFRRLFGGGSNAKT